MGDFKDGVGTLPVSSTHLDVYKRQGTEECRTKFEFALKQAKSMGKNGFYVFDQDDYEVFCKKEKL